ncbi:MAG: hypothetical protein KatS3mg076_2747 [Candidatus Binatia bacterium]|nr:MAG: hypothetical protein KatS3mg076_2747 [Candidatus Binatia bacterium]
MTPTTKVLAAFVSFLVLAPAALASPPEEFAEVHRHFLRGRELQKLHRNPPEAAAEFEKAYAGYLEIARRYPRDPIASRAQYMAGSAKLFLDQPDAAIAAYTAVLEKYPIDPAYVAKALLQRAMVEKNYLRPQAARRTLEQFMALDSKTPDLLRRAEKLERSLRLVGKKAPELQVRRWFRAGEPGDLARKGPRMIYFFTTWCPNCRKEAPFVSDLARRFAPRGFVVIGITDHSRGQTDGDIPPYLEKHGFRFPVGVDDGGKTSAAYEARSVPTLVLVDREGTVRWHDHPAALSDRVLEELLSGMGSARVR